MHVKVRLDPRFRTEIGAETTFPLELSEGATASDALAALVARWPELEPLLKTPAVTYSLFVNSRIVPRGRVESFKLKDGDTLHLLEPVVGG